MRMHLTLPPPKLQKLKSKMKVEEGAEKSTPKMRRLRKLSSKQAQVEPPPDIDGEPLDEDQDPAEAGTEKKPAKKRMTGTVDVNVPYVRLRTKTSSDSLGGGATTPSPARGSPRTSVQTSSDTATPPRLLDHIKVGSIFFFFCLSRLICL